MGCTGWRYARPRACFDSISTLLDLGLRIPDHTTLSRSSEDLNVRIPVSANDELLNITIDRTALRTHRGNLAGPSQTKRRAWKKPHVVVNANTGVILASVVTTHRARVAAQLPVLLAQVDNPLAFAMADGAHDTTYVYAAIEVHGLGPSPQILIQPRQDTRTYGRSTQHDHPSY